MPIVYRGHGNGKGHGNGGGNGDGSGSGNGNGNSDGGGVDTQNGHDNLPPPSPGDGNPPPAPGNDGPVNAPPPAPPPAPSPLHDNSPNAGNAPTIGTSSNFSTSTETQTPTLTTLPTPTRPIDNTDTGLTATSDSALGLPSDPANQVDLSNHSRGLSKGAVTGIVLLMLLGIAVIVLLIVRHRNRVLRRGQTEDMQQWWFASEKSARPSGASSRRELIMSPEDRQKIQSMRSSFGTSFDRGLLPQDDIIPSLPPILESEHSAPGSPVNWSVQHSANHPDLTTNSHLQVTNTFSSKHDGDQLSINPPLNVRPFSESERIEVPRVPEKLEEYVPNSPFAVAIPKSSDVNSSEVPKEQHSGNGAISDPFSDQHASEERAVDVNSPVETSHPFAPSPGDELGAVSRSDVHVERAPCIQSVYLEAYTGVQDG